MAEPLDRKRTKLMNAFCGLLRESLSQFGIDRGGDARSGRVREGGRHQGAHALPEQRDFSPAPRLACIPAGF